MIETGQIIFLVWAIIAFGALAAAPSGWTAILLVGVLGAWLSTRFGRRDTPNIAGDHDDATGKPCGDER
jgi:hypothetical protein